MFVCVCVCVCVCMCIHVNSSDTSAETSTAVADAVSHRLTSFSEVNHMRHVIHTRNDAFICDTWQCVSSWMISEQYRHAVDYVATSHK